MIDYGYVIPALNTAGAGWLEMIKVKIFGKRHEVKEGGYTIKLAKWNRKMYFLDRVKNNE